MYQSCVRLLTGLLVAALLWLNVQVSAAKHWVNLALNKNVPGEGAEPLAESLARKYLFAATRAHWRHEWFVGACTLIESFLLPGGQIGQRTGFYLAK